MKLIVGLGNPGKEYENTRHNIGFRVVEALADRWRIDMKAEKFHAWFGSGIFGDERVVLLKPTTFMNRSGQAVAAAVGFYRLEATDLLTVLDDTALDWGRLRLRKRGSAGGHNGLEDVITRLGSDEFCRLRVGIGEPVGSQTQYVLSRFGAQEQEQLGGVIDQAARAVECWMTQGPETTMNTYNAQP